MNTTVSTASTAYFNKTFYDRKLLDTAKTRFVHANFGQKRSIPERRVGSGVWDCGIVWYPHSAPCPR